MFRSADYVPSPIEPEAPTETVPIPTSHRAQVETDERLFRDLMERFSVLAETCSRFSREVYRRTRSPPELDPEGAVKASLAITRTVFNPWALDILATMYLKKSVRLKDLREALGRGTDETLTAHLNALDLYGLVQREVAAEAPNRARYSLTHKGLMIAQLGEPLFLYLRLAHGWSNREWDDLATSTDSEVGGIGGNEPYIQSAPE